MKIMAFISVLLLLLFNSKIFSQHHFDSIKICHSKNRELKNISIGEYEIMIQDGELFSLLSKDEAIKYEANSKLFIIKNLISNSYLKLQLSKEGVIVNVRDTSFLLNSPKSLGLSSQKEANDISVLYSIRRFSFSLEFKNNRINKISFATTGKFIVINLIQIHGVYTWDLGIESTNHSNQLLLTYIFNKPYLLSINDSKNKVGVRLLATKKNGFFNLLDGQRIYENNSFATDHFYNLKYNRKGKLKKQLSKFNLACEY